MSVEQGEVELNKLIEEGDQYMDENRGSLLDGNKKITSYDFDKYFRGFFMGKVPEEHLKKVGMAWLTFAGGSTAAVDIIHTVDGIDSLAVVVPALHDTSGIDVSNGMISRASRVKQLEANNLPIVAEKNFDIALADYLEDDVAVHDGDHTWAMFETWLHKDVEEKNVEKKDAFDRRSLFS